MSTSGLVRSCFHAKLNMGVFENDGIFGFWVCKLGMYSVPFTLSAQEHFHLTVCMLLL